VGKLGTFQLGEGSQGVCSIKSVRLEEIVEMGLEPKKLPFWAGRDWERDPIVEPKIMQLEMEIAGIEFIPIPPKRLARGRFKSHFLFTEVCLPPHLLKVLTATIIEDALLGQVSCTPNVDAFMNHADPTVDPPTFGPQINRRVQDRKNLSSPSPMQEEGKELGVGAKS